MSATPTSRLAAERLVKEYAGYVVDYAEQYLCPKGWFESIRTRHALDGSGPVPWITYPAIKVLESIVKSDFRVLEYGSGNSSRWWRPRVAQLVSVEHDPEWYQAISREPSCNGHVIHVPINAPAPPEFASFLEKEFFDAGLDPGPGPDPGRNLRAGLLSREFLGYACAGLPYGKGFFDVIVIDGMARVLTAWLAAQYVSDRGFVLFDNSDRDEYQAGYRCLRDAGFRRIDFWGTGPINAYEWCTSIFTRSVEIFS